MNDTLAPNRCPTCENLYPPGLSDRPAGQPAAVLLTFSTLKSSIASRCCRSCFLIRDALLPEYEKRKLSWDEAVGPLELRIEAGKPLKVFDRTNAIYLELFSETGRQ